MQVSDIKLFLYGKYLVLPIASHSQASYIQNMLSVTCKVIFTEYNSLVILALQLQNGFCDVKLEKI